MSGYHGDSIIDGVMWLNVTAALSEKLTFDDLVLKRVGTRNASRKTWAGCEVGPVVRLTIRA